MLENMRQEELKEMVEHIYLASERLNCFLKCFQKNNITPDDKTTIFKYIQEIAYNIKIEAENINFLIHF